MQEKKDFDIPNSIRMRLESQGTESTIGDDISNEDLKDLFMVLRGQK